MPDVIVTGLPRSGSTLVSALIDGLPNAVSLNAPAWQQALLANKTLDILPFCKWLVGDFIWTRQQMLEGETITDFRAADGSALLDALNDPRQKRDNNGEPAGVGFVRPDLKDDFILAMRNHAAYTSILPTLVKFKKVRIIAVIRHPFDVLSSWQRHMPQPVIARGRPHGIARFWPEALALCESTLDPAVQMVQLYDAFIQRYHELREFVEIVKLEDVIDDPMIVSRMFGLERLSANAARIEKRPRVLITSEVEGLRKHLRQYGVFTREYYKDI